MDSEYLILFFFGILVLACILKQREKYGTMPDLQMGYQWGSSPNNLYQSPEEIQNYFAEDLRKSLEEAEQMDTRYARGPGFGIGDIRKKLNTGLHAEQKIVYR